MNIVVLMAGETDKVPQDPDVYPKNLWEIDGKPLIQQVIEKNFSLFGSVAPHFTFMVAEEEDKRYCTGSIIQLLMPQAQIMKLRKTTAGAACTALLAIDQINNDEELVVFNGDIILDQPIEPIIAKFREEGLDGGIVVFNSVHPRWSYVKVDENRRVIEAAEKRTISNLATAGVYWFKHGSQFVTAAQRMIRKNATVNGKFYLCPVYNELVLENATIGIHEIARESYFSLKDTPDLESFREQIRMRQVAAAVV